MKIIILLFSVLFFPWTSYAISADIIYQRVSPSIFAIYGIDTENNHIKVQGSAVAITPTILATNCHIALAGNLLNVKTAQGNKRAAIVYHDSDICLIEVPGSNFAPVKIRNSNNVRIGEEVYAIGNPRGIEKTLSKGIISNEHTLKNVRLLQTDAAISPGSSGGGLFDNDGQLVGITTLVLRNAQNVNFALPTELISPYFNKQTRPHKTAEKVEKAEETPDKTFIFTNLGTFGMNQLRLYRAKSAEKNICFLFVPGRDLGGKMTSALIWEPKYPNHALIFPWIISVEQVLSTLQRIPMKTSDINTQLNTLLSKNLGDEPTLAPFKKIKFTNNPQEFFLQRKNLTVNIKEQHQIVPINFYFDALEEALTAYQNNCLN